MFDITFCLLQLIEQLFILSLIVAEAMASTEWGLLMGVIIILLEIAHTVWLKSKTIGRLK